MERLTNKERTVLEVFWRNDECLSVPDVALLLPDESRNTIAAITTKLLKKELIQVEKIEIVGKSLVRKFIPSVSEEEFLVSTLPDKTVSKLLVNQIKNATDYNYLERLQRIIDKRKESLPK